MNIRLIFALASAAALGGCETVAPYAPATAFAPADFAWAQGRGANSVSGNALLRTVGGEVRTCAGFPVLLYPDGPYASEWMFHAYNSNIRGFHERYLFVSPPTDPSLQSVARTETCDAQGNFAFEHIPDGKYYVETTVSWDVPGRYGGPQGGSLMQEVEVRNGETKKIVLTQQ